MKTLTTRVEQLTLENDELKKEAARLEKECESEGCELSEQNTVC